MQPILLFDSLEYLLDVLGSRVESCGSDIPSACSKVTRDVVHVDQIQLLNIDQSRRRERITQLLHNPKVGGMLRLMIKLELAYYKTQSLKHVTVKPRNS